MWKATINCLSLPVKALFSNASGNTVNVISVRYVRARKPFHLGTAKSKLFLVRPRREYPEEEAEMNRLKDEYLIKMRSLEEYLIKEYKHDQKRIIAEGQHEYIEKMKAEDKIKQRAMNDLWNNKCADAREKRLAAERATTRENIEKHIEERELADAEKLELIENVVRYEKEQSKTFVLPDKYDEIMEDMLENVTDFNFAIDLKQTVYEGRRSQKTVPANRIGDGR